MILTADHHKQAHRTRWGLSFICAMIFCGLMIASKQAFADGIVVQKAEARLVEDHYLLSANFDIRFNFVVEQALTRGVPLYFISEFTLTRPRWYWFDEAVVQNEQVTRLSYNALTRQYRVARGPLFQNFPTLEEALSVVSRQSAPAIPAVKPNPPGKYTKYFQIFIPDDEGDEYIAAVRMHLDVTQLPKPLQVNALATGDWNFDSEWYRWIVSTVPAEQK